MGACSMRSNDKPVQNERGNTVIGPASTLRDEAKKIAGTMKSINWDYAHSRAGKNAPGTGQTSAEKIGLNNQIIRDTQGRNKIREQIEYLKNSHFNLSVRTFGKDGQFTTTNQ